MIKYANLFYVSKNKFRATKVKISSAKWRWLLVTNSKNRLICQAFNNYQLIKNCPKMDVTQSCTSNPIIGKMSRLYLYRKWERLYIRQPIYDYQLMENYQKNRALQHSRVWLTEYRNKHTQLTRRKNNVTITPKRRRSVVWPQPNPIHLRSQFWQFYFKWFLHHRAF